MPLQASSYFCSTPSLATPIMKYVAMPLQASSYFCFMVKNINGDVFKSQCLCRQLVLSERQRTVLLFLQSYKKVSKFLLNIVF